MSQAHTQPWEYLADTPAEELKLLVIGCGNLLRGDDAAGPIAIRRLWEKGVTDTYHDIRLLDGGTSGMDVAFAMRGAEKVIIIDATTMEGEPGTIYRVPGKELETLPELKTMNSHDFRWDHALAFSRWLLGPYYPKDISVFLINAHNFEPGGVLSPQVDAAVDTVNSMIEKEIRERASRA